MSEILVPIISEERVSLYIVEANLKTGGAKSIDLCNKIKGQGFEGIDCIIDKIHVFFGKELNISIGLRDIETEKVLKAESISMSTQSITLGILAKVIELEEKRLLKPSYDYIILTGNYNDGKFISVLDIEKKIEIVKTLESINKKRSLFLYISEKEIIKSGLYNDNLQIEYLPSNSVFSELDDRIFIENFDEKQKEIIEEIAVDKLNEFIETELFRSLKTELDKGLNFGYVLVGRSNSGKTVITYNLCKYLMRKGKIYVPVWVTLNNSKLQEILKSEHISNSNTPKKEGTIVEKLKQYIESLLLCEFDLKLSYALVIDNLELDYCDELICAISLLLQEKKYLKYIFITSWWTCNNEKSLKSLEIKKQELSEINSNDFKGILNSIIDSQFTTKLQLLSSEEKKELSEVLYEELKYTPGEIALTLSSLQNISFQDLISKLKEDSKKPNEKRSYFLNLKFSQLGLFSQIVMYAYLSLYCNFDDKDSLQPEVITINDVKSRVCEGELINQELITNESISKALKQIKNSYLFEEIGTNKYAIKSDTIRFLLFALNEETIASQLVKKYISDITRINIAILYDCFDEFVLLMESSDYELRKQALIEICKNKNAKIKYLEFLKQLNVNFNEEDDEGWTAIHYAAWKNTSLTIIKFLCENCKVDLSRCSYDNKNILHIAAANDTLEVFQYIFSLGVFDINTCDQDKWTPLHYAARFTNNINVIKFIISKGADVLAETIYNQIPFHLAALNTNESIILYFLKNKKLSKSKNSIDDTGDTPICYAANINTNLQVIKYCFEFGCDYTNLNNDKENLFHLSAQNENPEVIKYLFENMDFDKYNNFDNDYLSPLGKAVLAGKNVEIIKLFHEKGINFSELDKNHANLLQISLINSNINIFKYLLSLNIFDINYEDINGNTIVHYAAEHNTNNEIIIELRKIKCDFLKRNLKGLSALHLAAKNPEDKILKKILNYHLYSDINEIDNNELSAIHYACMSGNEESIDILLHCGANLKQLGPNGENCLIFCAKENNIRVLQYLINKFFFTEEEINQSDKNGRSALCYAAASNDNTEIIDFLIEHGANIDVIDNDRFTLLHHAVRNTNLDMIKHMFNRGLFGHYSIDIPDNGGQTPLAYAIRYNENLDITKYLINKKNANTRLKISRKEFTYLHCATLNPNPQVLEYVIKNKKLFFDDISETDNDGNNAFSDAALYAQSIEIFELLYKARCTPRINENGDNILHLILKGLDEINFEPDSEYAKIIDIAEKKIRFIIDHNLCDINEYDGRGIPFIFLAISYPFNIKFLKELLDIADLNKLTKDGESIQQAACQRGNFELVNFLIDNGYITKEILNKQDNFGWTPLLFALRFNENVAVINKLLELNPDITVVTNYKVGLLEAVSYNSNIQILDLVLNKIGNNKINLGKVDGGFRPIHIACTDNSNPEILIRLQENGADISLTSTDGKTILHCAAKNKNVDIVKTVVEKLSFEDIFKKDDNGATALFYAAEENNYDVFEYLLKLGLSPYDTDRDGRRAIDSVDTAYKAKYEDLLKALYFF